MLDRFLCSIGVLRFGKPVHRYILISEMKTYLFKPCLWSFRGICISKSDVVYLESQELIAK
jgi:hypothetical protein